MRWIIWKGYLFRSYSRQERLWEFNQLKPSEGDKKVKYMKETFAECGDIYVGDKVMFGPNVTIATANHLINPELRETAMQYNKPVHIGENA